ncbi:MAG TPA: hypothetical protein VLE19_05445, partial [Pyrinomonadaceae bacterium]|nr:hypothetical protein [Pyrinomonadaceae bacterium]
MTARRRLAHLAWIMIISLLSLTVVCAQSGRRQEPGKTPKPAPSPIVDPTRPGGSVKSSTKGTKSPGEIDQDDIVRISS